MAKIFVVLNVVTPSDIVIVTREVSNLLAEAADRQFYAAPHTQRNITIDELDPVMYRVEIWTTNDGGQTLGQLKGSGDIDASITTTTAYRFINFIVDRGNLYDPVTPSDTYSNPDLNGQSYLVYKAGYGPLLWDIHIETIPGGGFKYKDGQSFFPYEEYTLQVSNTIQVQVPSGGGAGRTYPGGVVLVEGNVDLSNVHYNKILEVASSAEVVVISIPDFNGIPENTVFGINTHGGSQIRVELTMPNSFYCQVGRRQRNPVYIGIAEDVTFIKKGAYLRVVSWEGDFRRLGERVKTDGFAPLNSLSETGGWYLRSKYPRLVKWYIEELPLANVFTNVQDNATVPAIDRGYWRLGPTMFWVPDRGGYFDRNVDPNFDIDVTHGSNARPSGDRKLSMVGPHTHLVDPPESQGLGGYGYCTTGNDGPEATGIIPFRTNTNDGTGSGAETAPINIATNVYRII